MSPVPFVGAALLGLALASNPSTRPWAWLAVPADCGKLILRVMLPYLLFREFWSKPK